MVQQGVEQRPVGVPGGRMHDQPGRLVQHQDVLVLVDHLQRDVLRLPFALGLLFGLQFEHGPGMDDVTRAQHGTVDGEPTILDPAGQAGTGMLGKQLGGDLIQALTTEIEGHLGAHLDGLRGVCGHGGLRAGEPFGSALSLCLNTASLSRRTGAPIITGRLCARQPAVTGTQAAMQVKHLLLIAILALTAACSSNEPVDENLGEVELYQQAQADLDNKGYTNAIAKLKALESRYPFGRFAEQAQLELIYAYYRNVEPEAARAAADRFIRLHPQHPNVDYAYYLKGLASFDRTVAWWRASCRWT